MVFLHCYLKIDRMTQYEWGFRVEAAPVIGDTIDLFVRQPDTDDGDAEILRCRVVSRCWYLGYYHGGPDEVEVDVETEDPIPEGYVPDSEVWPSEGHSQRQAEFQKALHGERP